MKRVLSLWAQGRGCSRRHCRLLSSRSTGAGASFKHLSWEKKNDGAVWITMNRPDVHNAFNEHVIAELREAFKRIDAAECRSVVLTGNGKSFSAGADLNWMKKMAEYTGEENKKDALALFDMVNAIKKCPVFVIGRINGAALGGGAGLVAACDASFAVSKAKFGFTEVALGLIPAVISRFVMDRIGTTHASRYFLTGELFSASEAVRIGLIQQEVADEKELDEVVHKMTAQVSRNSPSAVRACKHLIENVSVLSCDGSRDLVASAIADQRVSEEGQEGLSSFLEKRTPSWREK